MVIMIEKKLKRKFILECTVCSKEIKFDSWDDIKDYSKKNNGWALFCPECNEKYFREIKEKIGKEKVEEIEKEIIEQKEIIEKTEKVEKIAKAMIEEEEKELYKRSK